MFEEALQDMEAMLDFGAHARLRLLQLFRCTTQLVLLERLADARPHSRVPSDCFVSIFRALGHTLVASIAQNKLLAAMQQCVRVSHVRYIAGRANDSVNQACSNVYAHVTFHPEVPVVTLLRLVHFWITTTILVLRRWWRRDQRGIDSGPLAHGQAFAGKVRFDLIENAASQVIVFEHAAKLEQRRCIGSRFVGEVDADKIAYRADIVNRVLRYLRRTIPGIAGRRTCAACAQDRSLAGRSRHPWDSMAATRRPGPAKASPHRSRTGSARAASISSCWQTRRLQSSFASSFNAADGMRYCATLVRHAETSRRLNQLSLTL